jgi:hypothetical protein
MALQISMWKNVEHALGWCWGMYLFFFDLFCSDLVLYDLVQQVKTKTTVFWGSMTCCSRCCNGISGNEGHKVFDASCDLQNQTTELPEAGKAVS